MSTSATNRSATNTRRERPDFQVGASSPGISTAFSAGRSSETEPRSSRQPASVYRRRRGLALAAVATLTGGALLGLNTLRGGDDPKLTDKQRSAIERFPVKVESRGDGGTLETSAVTSPEVVYGKLTINPGAIIRSSPVHDDEEASAGEIDLDNNRSFTVPEGFTLNVENPITDVNGGYFGFTLDYVDPKTGEPAKGVFWASADLQTQTNGAGLPYAKMAPNPSAGMYQPVEVVGFGENKVVVIGSGTQQMLATAAFEPTA